MNVHQSNFVGRQHECNVFLTPPSGKAFLSQPVTHCPMFSRLLNRVAHTHLLNLWESALFVMISRTRRNGPKNAGKESNFYGYGDGGGGDDGDDEGLLGPHRATAV